MMSESQLSLKLYAPSCGFAALIGSWFSLFLIVGVVHHFIYTAIGSCLQQRANGGSSPSSFEAEPVTKEVATDATTIQCSL